MSKESQSSKTYIKQNRLLKKDYNKRQKGALHNVKGSIQQEDITFINFRAHNIGAPKYVANINRSKEKLIAIQS